MLVLARGRLESLIIGDDIVITVVEIASKPRQRQVRLSIQAPNTVKIDRKEIRDSPEQTESAAPVSETDLGLQFTPLPPAEPKSEESGQEEKTKRAPEGFSTLVLTRKKTEQIIIGDDIVITVVEITSPNKVRLGIEAPGDVKVLRQEVYDKDRQTPPTDGQQQTPE